MNENQIIEQVSNEIDNWQSKMKKRNIRVKISEKAKKFIVELIENIQEDPSEYWKSSISFESLQILAINRIPEALDLIVRDKRIMYQRDMRYMKEIRDLRDLRDISISSWELWNSLSKILIRFCFIPEKDM